MSYDNDGNCTAVQTRRPQRPRRRYTTEYVYDALNRKIEEIQPAPPRHVASRHQLPDDVLAYDASGNLAPTTDPNGNMTSYVYNLEGRQTQITDALGDTTTDGLTTPWATRSS